MMIDTSKANTSFQIWPDVFLEANLIDFGEKVLTI